MAENLLATKLKLRPGQHAAVIKAPQGYMEELSPLPEAVIISEKLEGQVDICIVGPGGGWHPEPIEQLDTAGALEDLQHDVAPLYYLMPLMLPGMYQRKWGRFIGLSMHPTKLPPAYAYNSAKAARTQALLLAADPAWWSHGVTVNVVAPGPVGAIQSLEEAKEQCRHGRAWMERANTSPQGHRRRGCLPLLRSGQIHKRMCAAVSVFRIETKYLTWSIILSRPIYDVIQRRTESH